MKKIHKAVLIFFAAVFMLHTTVFADGTIKVMQVQNQGDVPSVFVKGIEGEVQSVNAVIGNVASEQVAVIPVSSENISMKTLVLMDNSLSIPNADRAFVKEIVTEIFASRSNNEQFALATYGESMEMLVDFTDDYGQLKGAVEGIEFQDRETYLTDVLYDLIQNEYFYQDEDKVYKRIFIISDGVDNKSLGYTKEELTEVLKENNVPLYTLGVYNSKKTNSDELSNMFALSRQTQADSFLLSDLDNTASVIDALSRDKNIIRFDIGVPAEIRDGSEKTITLNVQAADASAELKIDSVRMPQEVKEQPVVEEPKEESEPEKEPEVVPEPQEDKGIDTTTLIIMAVAAVAAIALITGIIIILVKLLKKKKKENALNEVENPFVPEEYEEKTEWLSGGFDGSDGNTVQIFDNVQRRNYVITLTDIASPAHSFQKTITDRIIIGRSTSSADICIDYEKSVSSKHCAIERRGDKFYLVDLQSSNGTFLDGNQVLSEIEIFSGCIIKMGRVQMRFEIG